ncbi:hypothetical protein P154DRAFT_164908 [Amniculicola lignicola CBS 123094]|uniref:DUF7730 domain-containing protein n=1 Tax=Amniculicola lignicola CBS 123094 TaxID=1392246 RepID=A0A6A5WKU4_9PLEO|nr:hypothetical protein P154DRAFT_164908 [Amniculicola lignicola CBS 123094]
MATSFIIYRDETEMGESYGEESPPLNEQPQSPVFNTLPGEVRNLIYEYALGTDGPTHMYQKEGGMIRSWACYKMGVEQRALHNQCWPTKFVGLPSTNHTPTPFKVWQPVETAQVKAPALLRTCKKIYKEARWMLYTKNTFHIRRSELLVDFRYSIAMDHFQAIRSLDLSIHPCDKEYSFCRMRVEPFTCTWVKCCRVVRSMSSLQELRVNLSLLPIARHFKVSRSQYDSHILGPLMTIRVPVFQVIISPNAGRGGPISANGGEPRPYSVDSDTLQILGEVPFELIVEGQWYRGH